MSLQMVVNTRSFSIRVSTAGCAGMALAKRLFAKQSRLLHWRVLLGCTLTTNRAFTISTKPAAFGPLLPGFCALPPDPSIEQTCQSSFRTFRVRFRGVQLQHPTDQDGSVWVSRHLAAVTRAVQGAGVGAKRPTVSVRNHSRFSNSSHSVPLKLSTKPFCHRLPGAMKAGPMASSLAQHAQHPEHATIHELVVGEVIAPDTMAPHDPPGVLRPGPPRAIRRSKRA